MLIPITKKDLYDSWVKYYELLGGMKPYEIRTFAFLKSNNNEYIPLNFSNI